MTDTSTTTPKKSEAAKVLASDDTSKTQKSQAAKVLASDDPRQVAPVGVPAYEEPSKGELIAFGGIVAAVLSVIGGGVWWDYRQQKNRREENKRLIEEKRRKRQETEEWVNDHTNQGNKVFTLKDGRYLVVPMDAKFTTHLRD